MDEKIVMTRRDLERIKAEAIEAARAKDPFNCEYGHEVYSHTTAEGWCCACPADIATLSELTKGKV